MKTLTSSLDEIDEIDNEVYIIHEKFEKLIPKHKHVKGQLSYVEGGIAYVTIDNQTFVVPSRHFFWIPPNVWHIVKLGHHATIFRCIYYAVDATDNQELFFQKVGIYRANELLIQMISYTERWDFQGIGKEEADFTFLQALKDLLPQLINDSIFIGHPVSDDEKIQHITNYMQENLAQALSLQTVSQYFSVSERTLSRLFKKHLKISFLQYLKMARIIKSIDLLLKTDLSITEIAYEVGYNSVNSFSDTFNEYLHARPSAFRQHQQPFETGNVVIDLYHQ